jgi:hypothetical protein
MVLINEKKEFKHRMSGIFCLIGMSNIDIYLLLNTIGLIQKQRKCNNLLKYFTS